MAGPWDWRSSGDMSPSRFQLLGDRPLLAKGGDADGFDGRFIIRCLNLRGKHAFQLYQIVHGYSSVFARSHFK